MALNFNTTPYYDDFDEDKNFHRLLFRPGRAVQARELTQTQTVLQDQITKFGNHLFKDGSRVTGAEVFGIGEGKLTKVSINIQPSVNHINLSPLLPEGGVLNQSPTAVNVASFINTYITVPLDGIGPNNALQNINFSNTIANNVFYVHHADAAANGDPDTLYVSFLKSENLYYANGSLKVPLELSTRSALPGELGNNFISSSIGNVSVDANSTMNVYSTIDLNSSNLLAQVTANSNPFGDAKLLGVTEGVFYTNGVFVKNREQIIAADKYAKTANVSVGFEVTESIVKSSDDASLLDPALESSNYLAVGADRYKISLNLARKQLDTNTSTIPELSSTKYIELVRYKNGQLAKDASGTKYSDLGRTLARRTFDESGDYIVNGIEPIVRSYGNSAAGAVTVTKGKAYVKGYEIIQPSDTILDLPKTRTTENVTAYSLEQNYGNFIYVSGANNTLFTDSTNFQKVSLHSSNIAVNSRKTGVPAGSANGGFGLAANTKIGEAHVKNVEFFQNEGDLTPERNVYRLSLFNIRNTSNVPLSLTRAIVAIGESSTANGVANVDSRSILNSVGGAVGAELANGTNNMIVTNSTGIRVGDMVEGYNVSNNGFNNNKPASLIDGFSPTSKNTANLRIAYVTAVRGTNVEISCTVFSGTSTDLGVGGFTSDGISRQYTFTRTVFSDTNEDRSVFPMTYNYVANTGATGFTYQTRKVFPSVSFVSGVGTIQSGDANKTFIASSSDSEKRKNYQVTVLTGGTSSTPSGNLVPVISSVTVTGGATPQAQIDIGDSGVTGTANVVATVIVQSAQNDRRTLTSNRVFKEYAVGTHTQTENNQAKKISLGRSYVVNVEAIYIASGTDAASNSNVNVRDAFTFDTGQREGFFDYGTIKLRANNTIANGYPDTAKINVGKMNVVFNHISAVGSGFIDVASYNPVIAYEKIPQFTKKDGTIISLRDSIDFRPIRVTDNTPNVYSNNNMVFTKLEMPDTEDPKAAIDISYHLPRKDKVVLGFDGVFRVIQGEPALNDPPVPADDPDSMTIAKLTSEPYAPSASNVQIELVKNKRYTMKDISGLDDRLTRVEYYTSLNLLESEIASSTFFSNNNTELLGNGFVVDSFRGHGIADVANPDHKVSIDYDNQTLRPRFKANAATSQESSSFQTLENTGGLLTLPFTKGIYQGGQFVATGTTNINPFSVVGFVGHVKLETDVATYADFETRPFVGINVEGNSDNFQFGENFVGSKWGEWDLLSYDRSDAKVYTYYDTTNQKSKTSTSAEASGYLSQKTEIDKVYYYAQKQNIDFEIFGFRPNTVVQAYIDGKFVSHLIRRFDADLGDYVTAAEALVSNENGFAKGRILLNNDPEVQRFFAGEHQIIFCNSILNPTFHTTIATTRYFSGTPIVPEVQVEQTVVEQNDFVQTPSPQYNCEFYMNDEPENQECITRSALNQRILAGGTVSASVIANWGPVIYGIYQSVLLRIPEPGGYQHWLERVETGWFGAIQNKSGDPASRGLIEAEFRRSEEYNFIQQGIYVDPLAQTFFVNELTNPKGIFVASVSVWFATKDDTLPVTLQIRKTVNGYPSADDILLDAVTTLNPGDVKLAEGTLTQANKTEFNFTKPIFLEPDEYSIVLLTNSKDYTVFIATVGATRLDNGQVVSDQPYTGSLFKSQNARTWEPDQLSDLAFEVRQCVFNTSGNFFTDVEPVIGTLPTQFVDYMKISAPYQTHSKTTSLTFDLSTTANGGSSLGTARNVYPGADINFDERQKFSATGEANLRVTMATTNADVSPVFDLKRCRFIFVENLINASSNSEITVNPETQNEGGGAQSKYITKKVKLGDDFDATSLRVIISKNLPEGASVEVYYRVQSSVDSTEFEDLPFVLMDQYTPSLVSQNYTDFYDCEYRAEDITYVNADTTFDNFRFFAIKVVLYSTNTAKTPSIKNFRAIALS